MLEASFPPPEFEVVLLLLRIIPVRLIVSFEWEVHKRWDCLKSGSAAEVFRDLAGLCLPLSFLIYLLIKKKIQSSPHKKLNQGFCLFIQGKVVFPLVKATSQGSYCFEC